MWFVTLLNWYTQDISKQTLRQVLCCALVHSQAVSCATSKKTNTSWGSIRKAKIHLVQFYTTGLYILHRNQYISHKVSKIIEDFDLNQDCSHFECPTALRSDERIVHSVPCTPIPDYQSHCFYRWVIHHISSAGMSLCSHKSQQSDSVKWKLATDQTKQYIRRLLVHHKRSYQ